MVLPLASAARRRRSLAPSGSLMLITTVLRESIGTPLYGHINHVSRLVPQRVTAPVLAGTRKSAQRAPPGSEHLDPSLDPGALLPRRVLKRESEVLHGRIEVVCPEIPISHRQVRRPVLGKHLECFEEARKPFLDSPRLRRPPGAFVRFLCDTFAISPRPSISLERFRSQPRLPKPVTTREVEVDERGAEEQQKERGEYRQGFHVSILVVAELGRKQGAGPMSKGVAVLRGAEISSGQTISRQHGPR